MNTSRRSFIKQASLGLAAPLILKSSLFGKNSKSPNEIVNIGLIGLGQMAWGHLGFLIHSPRCRLAAICDVDRKRIEFNKGFIEKHHKNNGKGGEVKTYTDFRDMLADQSIDAVYIITPDHWHATMSVMAARAGKHIYCEKPMTFTMEEARKVETAVKEAGVAFQVGSQQRSEETFRKAAFLARNGYLGEIKEVFCQLAWSMAVPQNWPLEECPDYIDWDMWCGPAPLNPYSNWLLPKIDDSEAPYNKLFFPIWRDHIDYGNSNGADWGAHHYDITLWGLGLDGKGPKYMEVTDKGDMPGSKNWRQYRFVTESGTKIYKGTHPDSGAVDAGMVTFVGTEGIAGASRGNKFYGSKAWMSDARLGDKDIMYPRVHSHHDNFMDAIYNGTKTIAPVEAGRSSSEISIMGNIGFRLGRNLEWDYNKGKFVGDDDANKFLSRPARDKWALI